MKAKLIIAFLSLILVSCNNEKKSEKNEAIDPVAAQEKNFKVGLNLTIKKDDDIALFYTEDGTINFNDGPVWMGVKGNDAPQTMIYTLPEDVLPTQLRIDFGVKENQEDIVLHSVTFEYGGRKRVIAGAELGNYFRPDDSKCTFDPATGLIKALVQDGKRLSPSLYPHEANLQPELEKIGQ